MLYQKEYKTPIGPMVGIASTDKLLLLEFKSRKELDEELLELKKKYEVESIDNSNQLLDSLESELMEYFNGKRQKFNTPIELDGTEFQIKVWSELLLVPYGETRTYLDQARSLGDEKAIRAMASANGKNRLAIIVPCHRIIGSDGSLTGYAGGIEKKRFLLNLEREVAGPRDLFSK